MTTTQELLARAAAMNAQTSAEGTTPFAGSSYEKGLNTNTPVPTSTGAVPQDSSGGLLDFKNSLNQVVQLAKEKRNSLSLDFMKPFQGTVAASDFNSILGNLNKASDTFTADTLKLATPTYKTDQIGSDLYQYQVDGSGKIIGEPVKVLSGGSSGSEKLSHQDKVDQGYQILDSLIGLDKNGQPIKDETGLPYTDVNGYFTVKGFQKLSQEARADGISRDDFIKQYASHFSPFGADTYGLTVAEKKLLYEERPL